MKHTWKSTVFAGLFAVGALGGTTAAQAQIPAFLPKVEQVQPGEATDADGTYVVSTINKRITIERGRAYVVDPWNHALVLRVQRGMVTLKNFRQTGPNQFEADDLPMMGKVIFDRQPNGTLQGVVQGAGGEAKYALVPTEYAGAPGIDDPGLGAPPPAPAKPRIYRLHVSGSNCAGKSLLRKRYRGVVRISVVDREGDVLLSKSRNFSVRCTDKGPRSQNYRYYKDGPGSLTMTIPQGADGFSDLRVRGTLNDPLGRVDFNNNKSDLLAQARALGRDLNVNEKVKDKLKLVNAKAALHFTITMERVQ
ncbi:hypothetical protein SAMN02745824_1794 [Parasphingorhabdus marina DSM 22363]|uniref:Uncharacterized protein n=1 Tax=Parasphingorhabdus marina DSM 22363 TaxID=1123272 RepID=A0A1N6DBV2_9SPHN|nr:hypothetical protein [Parasphingorhabdus marina]SIN68227.1 hypothetical protein SAMN02745824_1794 [Parasphingorhabdus marina DSM 22363]